MISQSSLQTGVVSVNPTTGASGAKTGTDRKLKDAAEQFEAIFLQEMLKPMQSGSEGFGAEEAKDRPAGSDTLSSFGTEAVAKAIAKSGGLGIARQIVQKVSLERVQHESGKL